MNGKVHEDTAGVEGSLQRWRTHPVDEGAGQPGTAQAEQPHPVVVSGAVAVSDLEDGALDYDCHGKPKK